MQDSIRQTTNGREGDIRPTNQAYQPNQDDLSHDSTCSRNLTHDGILEKKNWCKIFPHERDIQLSSRRTSKEPEGDQRLLIEAFRLNQEEPSCKPTCFGNLIHQRQAANWIHIKIHYGSKVIQLLNQEKPKLPYLEAHGFNSFLFYLYTTWMHPTHPRRLRDIKDELGLIIRVPMETFGLSLASDHLGLLEEEIKHMSLCCCKPMVIQKGWETNCLKPKLHSSPNQEAYSSQTRFIAW